MWVLGIKPGPLQEQHLLFTAEYLPSPLESQPQFFQSFFALLAQQLILVRKVFKVFSLSKAPFFFSCLIQELTPMLGKQEDATCELCVSSRGTMTMTKHIQ